MRQQPYISSYCNRAHDLADGKPIAHECYCLNPSALRQEVLGNVDGALAIGIVAEPVRIMRRGKRRTAS